MIRGVLMLICVLLVGLFGYYFFSYGTGGTADKAKAAAHQVGEIVYDEAAEKLIRASLAKRFGYDSVAFVHVYFHDGKALIYGLVPEGIDPLTVLTETQGVSGVREAEVLLSVRPAYVRSVLNKGPAPTP